MKTSELIAILQKADPSGQMKVVLIETPNAGSNRFAIPLKEPDVGILTEQMLRENCAENCGLDEDDVGRPFVAI